MSPATLAAIMAAAYRHQRPWSEAELAATLDTAGIHLFTRARAFLLVRILAGEAEILALATAPEAQRNSHAAALVDEFHKAARAAGAERAFLEVAAGNAPARAFYAKAGYSETGRRPGYYRRDDGTRDDALVLARAL